ncbi:MAG: diguanylate cyclase, partial [Deltaproteobacteria bacterium]
MPGKLLIVDDSKTSRGSIRNILKDVFSDFIEADNGLTAIRLFTEEKPGFIITDVEMPKADGYKFVSAVRAIEGGGNVPVIMFSGKKRTLKNKLDGLKIGAGDYLFKPFDGEELVARVKSLLKMRELMEGLMERNVILEKLAVTDTLTGLYNRRHFFDAAKEQMALGLRHSFKIACLLIDIDHFKMVNDTWGHQAGDDVLRNVGRLMLLKKRDGELMA